MTTIKDYETNHLHSLDIPLKSDGSEYSLHDLFPDQRRAVVTVLHTLHDFLTTDDLTDFKPLRMTVNGQGGSGKSVVINTLLTVIRKMVGFTGVAKVIAPTGVAACNVSGETFHHLFNMPIAESAYKAKTMSKSTRMKLISKFELILALIIDERSLMTSKLFGTSECMMAETIYGGGHNSDVKWGGLPILVLVGDDFQLPGFGEGALHVLSKFSCSGSKMVVNGRQQLLEAAETVVDLGASKRVRESEVETKSLMARLRIGNPNDSDIDKLLSLHLENVKQKHGVEMKRFIESKALYLFFKNAKRVKHNNYMLSLQSSSENPVARIFMQSKSNKTGKGIKRHFDGDIPFKSMICVGAMVRLIGRNFNPLWGLYNGAGGIVKEIIFREGTSPNDNHMPSYIVVEFPNYTGPPWDLDNPKVSSFKLLTTK